MVMQIALIDDGIDPAFCPGLLPEYDLCVYEDGRVQKRAEPIWTDHGTTSARIISRYAPAAEFCSLRVFTTERLKASLEQLLGALAWCRRERIPIIHMSLGSTQKGDYEVLRKAAAGLIQNGQILVAAHSNNSAYTMPACFMGVFGVMADQSLCQDDYYVRERADWNQVQIFASSRHSLQYGEGVTVTTETTNSYAAPVITAKVHEILCALEEGRRTVGRVYAELAGHPVTPFRLRPDFVEDAVLYQGQTAIHQELLFFSVREHVDSAEGLRLAAERFPQAPLVVVPSGRKAEDDWLYRFCMNGSRRAVLFAGKAFQGVQNPEILFWDETQYQDSIAHMPELQEEGFPENTARIVVEGEEQFSLAAARKILRMFERNDYPAIIVSDYPYSYLYGMEYLPAGADAGRLGAAWAASRRASVVIFCLKKETVRPGYDFIVSVGVEMRICSEQISLSKEMTEKEIAELYQYILDYEPPL